VARARVRGPPRHRRVRAGVPAGPARAADRRDRDHGDRRSALGLRWWLVALALPLGVAAVTGLGALIVATFGFGFDIERDFGAFNGFPATSPIALWLMLVVINGLGEEAGWRGFLLPELQRRWSPIASSLIVGCFWAAWHAPAFFITETYRAMPPAMIPMFLVGIVSGSVFLTWLYNRGRSSILLVAVWHATYNLFSGSQGARGALAAIESTVVMVIAALLLVQELRTIRRGDVHHPMEHEPDAAARST
jgi:membrane protease YdiL (CAAX protease family)